MPRRNLTAPPCLGSDRPALRGLVRPSKTQGIYAGANPNPKPNPNQDPRNMPGREEMREIVRGCCRANATLCAAEL